jgi:hypothetical protein
VSKRKISNKRLSRNLKAHKTPLRVLPMTSFRLRHQEKEHSKVFIKKQKVEGIRQALLPPPSLQCKVEDIHHQVGRRVKKSWRMKPIIIKPLRSLHSSVSAVRWIVLIIFIYLVAGMAVVMIQDGTESLKNIVVYSIIGFFTFFMGYLGWILARDVLQVVSGKKLHNEAELEA